MAPRNSILLLTGVLLLSGCVKDNIPLVYRPNVQQGNVVTKEMLARLEPGMAKRKVRFLLGTPLIIDTFNQDRWDYIYTFRPLYGNNVRRQVSLYFVKDRLQRLDGDVKELGTVKPEEPKERVVTVPRRNPDDGLIASIVNPINPFSNDKKPEKKTDAFDAEAGGETATAAQEPGFLERMKRAFGGGDEPAAEQTEAPAVAAESVTTESDQATGEEPGFFERMKRTLQSEGDDLSAPDAETPAQPAETTEFSEVEPESADAEEESVFQRMRRSFLGPQEPADADNAPAQSAAEEESVFERMRKAFSSSDQAEKPDQAGATTEPASPPIAADEPPPAETATDEDGGFFRRLADRFRLSIGIGEAKAEEKPQPAPDTAAEPEPAQ